MSNAKKQEMVDEILAWIALYRKEVGVQPTQQEVDDFLYSWQRKRHGP